MDRPTTGTPPSSRSRDMKTRINIKNPVRSNIDHLPALVVNGGGNRLKSALFGTSEAPWPWPWPWIGSYGIPSCISHRSLSTNQISLKPEKLFVDGRTDERTDVPTDGHFPPLMLLGRLGGVDLNLYFSSKLINWWCYWSFKGAPL